MYYIILRTICQELFSSFSKLFLTYQSLVSSLTHVPYVCIISYFPLFVKNFFEIFKKVFEIFGTTICLIDYFLDNLLSLLTWTLYHTSFRLSRTFLNFLKVYFVCISFKLVKISFGFVIREFISSTDISIILYMDLFVKNFFRICRNNFF